MNAVQNVLMWRTSAAGRLTLFSMALSPASRGLFTQNKAFLSKCQKMNFLGRHNKTAYYITNHMHLQKSSPRREKSGLGIQRAEFCHRKMTY